MSKYNAKRTKYNGVNYASKAEAMRAMGLDILKLAGEIKVWIGQPVFRLGVSENKYVADFLVIPWVGVPWVEDVKGFETPRFKHNKKLWKRYGCLDLHILKGENVEIVKPEEV